MAAKSLRCVALAYKPFDLNEVPNEEQRANWSLPEDDLILLSIVGMKVKF
jgi:P-type Ca2+ transporter type 2C